MSSSNRFDVYSNMLYQSIYQRTAVDFNRNIFTVPTDDTNLASGDYARLSILNVLLVLLTDSIDHLQNAAAHQADRLQILTAWQKAYTDKIAQIPTFVQDPSSGVAIYGSQSAEKRTEANTFNSTLTEKLRGYNTLVQNDSKMIQSNIDQSNNTVSQQANLVTALLQQLSSILGNIFP